MRLRERLWGVIGLVVITPMATMCMNAVLDFWWWGVLGVHVTDTYHLLLNHQNLTWRHWIAFVLTAPFVAGIFVLGLALGLRHILSPPPSEQSPEDGSGPAGPDVRLQ